MTLNQLREKIRTIVRSKMVDSQPSSPELEYDELTKFPELKYVIVDLLTNEFDYFLASIDWVAPRPTTFRINLKNGQEFYLIYNGRSWVAQVEGKKYYLLNLPEEEKAAQAISRILRYGEPPSKENSEEGGEDTEGFVDSIDIEEPAED